MCHLTEVQCSALHVTFPWKVDLGEQNEVPQNHQSVRSRNCDVNPGASGTDYNIKKHSNRAGGFVDVVLRLRSTSIVKMIAAGVKHERCKVLLFPTPWLDGIWYMRVQPRYKGMQTQPLSEILSRDLVLNPKAPTYIT